MLRVPLKLQGSMEFPLPIQSQDCLKVLPCGKQNLRVKSCLVLSISQTYLLEVPKGVEDIPVMFVPLVAIVIAWASIQVHRNPSDFNF